MGEIGNVKPTNPITTHHFLSPGLPLLHWGGTKGGNRKGSTSSSSSVGFVKVIPTIKGSQQKTKITAGSTKIHLYKQSDDFFFKVTIGGSKHIAILEKKKTPVFFQSNPSFLVCVYQILVQFLRLVSKLDSEGGFLGLDNPRSKCLPLKKTCAAGPKKSVIRKYDPQTQC